MSILISIFTCVFALFIVWTIYVLVSLRKHRESFKKNGLPFITTGIVRPLRMLSGYLKLPHFEDTIYTDAISTGAPLVGLTEWYGQTSYYITDPNLLKSILVKDFDHFADRRQFQSQNVKSWSNRMLFFMQGQQWKDFRVKMSPTFTTGKIRKMFQIFKASSEKMEKYIKQHHGYPNNKSFDVEISKLFSKYSMDAIAGSVFAIDSKSWEVDWGKVSTFERMGQKIAFEFSLKMVAKFIFLMLAPRLAKLFDVEMLEKDATKYFSTVVKQVIKRRRETGERQEDYLQLMLDAQQGLLKADEETNKVMMGDEENDGQVLKSTKLDTGSKGFEDDDIVANGMLFFIAGFGSTHSVMLTAMYYLATQVDVQEKLRKEVDSAIKRNGGELTYQGISEMAYLDMIINESIRCLPIAPRTERVCTKTYQVPGTNTVIEKGSLIVVPIRGLHKDKRHWPSPEKFIPERFTQEGKASRHPYAFVPFGYGPRNCIGMRFALLKMKTVIAYLVGQFEIHVCSKTQIPLDFGNSVTKPKEGLWLKLTERNKVE